MKIIGLIDPSIGSFNLGDEIVSHYCKNIIHKMFPNHFFISIPAYMECDERMKEIIEKSEHIFFLGTAPINHEITFRWPLIVNQYNNKVVLMGVGYNNWASGGMGFVTRNIYFSNLSKKYKHSIRDGYSKILMENQIGISAINTCCPTLWNNIEYKPFDSGKCASVLFTVNSSRGDKSIDKKIITTINKIYDKIFFYAQTPNDFEYFRNCCIEIYQDSKISINFTTIKSNFKDLTNFITSMHNKCDYFGARLHGGIHARNLGMRSFIIGVDNRAIQIHNDTRLPVYTYSEINTNIDLVISAIYANYNWDLYIPEKEINKWKDQFK